MQPVSAAARDNSLSIGLMVAMFTTRAAISSCAPVGCFQRPGDLDAASHDGDVAPVTNDCTFADLESVVAAEHALAGLRPVRM